MTDTSKTADKKHPFREIVQPFIDLVRAPRALWGVNLGYFLEGFAYWGVLGYLAMYFNDYVGLDDIWAGRMVGVLTAGITIAMFFLGGVADKWGIRFALIAALGVMLLGRVCLSVGPTIGLEANGLWSPVFLVAMGGILLVVIGYGMYQPAAYAAVRKFTTEKTAPMGFAMLYALMNLGGFLPFFFSPVREAIGISGCYWIFGGVNAIALLATLILLTRKTVSRAVADAKAEREQKKDSSEPKDAVKNPPSSDSAQGDRERDERVHLPVGFWLTVWAVLLALTVYLPSLLPDYPALYFPKVGHWIPGGLVVVYWLLPRRVRNGFQRWLKNHPLANPKFAFFIFALIPVQTLFAHNWLTLPMYVERAYRDSWPFISDNFEKAVNFNPLLIFIFVPIVTALTQKRNVYNMMIVGTCIMAAPAFLLTLGAQPWTLVSYLIIMTIGEAMWQPRFLQYAAEIAPEGRTGAYMGVAQFPWFLTKVIVPFYSGWFLQEYCPKEGVASSERMWFIYACIAMVSTVVLVLAKGWVGKDFKTRAD